MDIARRPAYDRALKRMDGDVVVALGGNPNVGKSTVFNQLTGLRQHTGNWPGKTVASAEGRYRYRGVGYIMVDIPGTYSLMANSQEEEIARDFICFGEPDVTVVVADATCLERNLNLLLQVTEITNRVVLCVNLMDEAKKKRIRVDLAALSGALGVPVVGASARSGKGLKELMEAVSGVASGALTPEPPRVPYPEAVERAVSHLEPAVKRLLKGRLGSRWVALRLLDGDGSLLRSLSEWLGRDILEDAEVAARFHEAAGELARQGITQERFRDLLVSGIVSACERAARQAVSVEEARYLTRDQKIDRVLTSKAFGIPAMIGLLMGIFWLTITGANAPSRLISGVLTSLMEPLRGAVASLRAAPWLTGLLIDGMYKTLSWVVSVMLPPMAIFFPLFTLLEDLGYLPRVAFNLDEHFRRARAHGKQSLTMMMGFGCNACGVTGCRIIDSPRERLIAILTNCFVPCNGRFPTLIAIIAMFFAGGPMTPTLMLTGAILFSVLLTLAVSRLLSATILRGVPSSFQLELPPYRRPQIGKVIVRSILDRTVFVLGRAAAVAAPAGLVIWLMANIPAGGGSALTACAGFLDPLGHLMGLDGTILMAFLLGFPANEVVIPILIMSYMRSGSLTDFASLDGLRALFVSHGWTWLTALNAMLFSLMHWPCGTTLITIRRETGSRKWTLAAFLIPTILGVAACALVAGAARLLGLV